MVDETAAAASCSSSLAARSPRRVSAGSAKRRREEGVPLQLSPLAHEGVASEDRGSPPLKPGTAMGAQSSHTCRTSSPMKPTAMPMTKRRKMGSDSSDSASSSPSPIAAHSDSGPPGRPPLDSDSISAVDLLSQESLSNDEVRSKISGLLDGLTDASASASASLDGVSALGNSAGAANALCSESSLLNDLKSALSNSGSDCASEALSQTSSTSGRSRGAKSVSGASSPSADCPDVSPQAKSSPSTSSGDEAPCSLNTHSSPTTSGGEAPCATSSAPGGQANPPNPASSHSSPTSSASCHSSTTSHTSSHSSAKSSPSCHSSPTSRSSATTMSSRPVQEEDYRERYREVVAKYSVLFPVYDDLMETSARVKKRQDALMKIQAKLVAKADKQLAIEQRLTESQRELDAKIAHENEAVKELELEREKLSTQLRDSRAETTTAEKRATMMEKLNKELVSDFRKEEAKRFDLREEISALNARMRATEKAQEKKHFAQIEDMRRAHEKEIKEREHTELELNKKVKRLQKINDSLSFEREDAINDANKLSSQLAETRVKLDKARKETPNAVLTVERDQARYGEEQALNKLGALEKALDARTKELQVSQKKAADIEKRMEYLKDKHRLENERLAKLHNDTIAEERASASAKLRALRREIAERDETITHLEGIAKRLQERSLEQGKLLQQKTAQLATAKASEERLRHMSRQLPVGDATIVAKSNQGCQTDDVKTTTSSQGCQTEEVAKNVRTFACQTDPVQFADNPSASAVAQASDQEEPEPSSSSSSSATQDRRAPRKGLRDVTAQHNASVENELRREIKELERQLSEYKEAEAMEPASIHVFMKETFRLREDIENVAIEREEAESMLAELREEHQKLCEEHQGCVDERDMMEKEHIRVQQELTQIQLKHTTIPFEHTHIYKDHQTMKAELARVRDVNTRLDSQSAATRRELDGVRADLRKEKQRSKEAEESWRADRSKVVQDHSRMREELVKKHTNLEREMQQLRQQNESLNRKVHRLYHGGQARIQWFRGEKVFAEGRLEALMNACRRAKNDMPSTPTLDALRRMVHDYSKPTNRPAMPTVGKQQPAPASASSSSSSASRKSSENVPPSNRSSSSSSSRNVVSRPPPAVSSGQIGPAAAPSHKSRTRPETLHGHRRAKDALRLPQRTASSLSTPLPQHMLIPVSSSTSTSSNVSHNLPPRARPNTQQQQQQKKQQQSHSQRGSQQSSNSNSSSGRSRLVVHPGRQPGASSESDSHSDSSSAVSFNEHGLASDVDYYIDPDARRAISQRMPTPHGTKQLLPPPAGGSDAAGESAGAGGGKRKKSGGSGGFGGRSRVRMNMIAHQQKKRRKTPEGSAGSSSMELEG